MIPHQVSPFFLVPISLHYGWFDFGTNKLIVWAFSIFYKCMDNLKCRQNDMEVRPVLISKRMDMGLRSGLLKCSGILVLWLTCIIELFNLYELCMANVHIQIRYLQNRTASIDDIYVLIMCAARQPRVAEESLLGELRRVGQGLQLSFT